MVWSQGWSQSSFVGSKDTHAAVMWMLRYSTGCGVGGSGGRRCLERGGDEETGRMLGEGTGVGTRHTSARLRRAPATCHRTRFAHPHQKAPASPSTHLQPRRGSEHKRRQRGLLALQGGPAHHLLEPAWRGAMGTGSTQGQECCLAGQRTPQAKHRGLDVAQGSQAVIPPAAMHSHSSDVPVLPTYMLL